MTDIILQLLQYFGLKLKLDIKTGIKTGIKLYSKFKLTFARYLYEQKSSVKRPSNICHNFANSKILYINKYYILITYTTYI